MPVKIFGSVSTPSAKEIDRGLSIMRERNPGKKVSLLSGPFTSVASGSKARVKGPHGYYTYQSPLPKGASITANNHGGFLIECE